MIWIEIANHISEVTGNDFQISDRHSVSGGDINQGYTITNGNLTYFVKLNQAALAEMFVAEAWGLKQMLATATIRVPQPICWGSTGNSAYLVLEYLALGRGNSQSWLEMGRQLAALHKSPAPRQQFGADINNTIGSTPQINTWQDSWTDFFAQNRIRYQLQLAQRRGGNFSQGDNLVAAIPQLLANYKPVPSLVHGDLWGGNAACLISGEPVIFDPATYWGDREVDLAMTELFGGFPREFYQGYQQIWPLDPGYEQRKPLYNLYHILNHFNLFGGSYASQANSMINRLLQNE
jgi:fructosamine-3-kinase